MKIFLDHLYFSLIAILFGGLGLYLALYILDSMLSGAGHSMGITKFSFGGNLLALTIIWVTASLILAAALTYKTKHDAEEPEIDFTGRRKM
jgi:hypothetical protein